MMVMAIIFFALMVMAIVFKVMVVISGPHHPIQQAVLSSLERLSSLRGG